MTEIKVNEYTLLMVEVPEDINVINPFTPKILTNKDISDLPEGSWSILGTITKEGIFDFDPIGYVRKRESGRYVHAIDPETLYFENANDAFICELKSENIYLNNPMGDKPEYPNAFIGDSPDTAILKEWQEYESKTLKQGFKLLIIKQKKI